MKIAILGASRGLGRSLVESAPQNSTLWLASRSITSVEIPTPAVIAESIAADFSKLEQFNKWLGALQVFQPDKIIYCAGGGPYGEFGQKKWPSHEWSLNVCLMAPAKLIHWASQKQNPPQVIVIGSSVAEAKPDPMAGSYAAAKHGLKGLHSSVIQESTSFDFRLFSPGYMDTELLPQGSPPRQGKKKIWSPQQVAQKIWLWSEDSNKFQSHHILEEFTL